MQHLPLVAGCEPRCPGCAHRRWPFENSLEQKQQWLAKRLAPWSDQLQPIRHVAEADRFNYRDKVCLSCRWIDNSWQFGLIRDEELIAIPDCPVHSIRIRDTQRLLCEKLPPYEQFPLAYWVQSGKQSVLVLKQKILPNLDWLNDATCQELQKIGIEGLWLHLHPSAGKKVFAKNQWQLLWGKPRSVDNNGLCYGPAAFQQLIPELADNAQYEADQFLAPSPDSQVVDLYCGIGSTLRRWVAKGGDCTGVELGAEAVACAQLNVPQATVLRGSCHHRIPQLQQWSEDRSKTRLLYTNPPRTGMEPELLAWITNHYQPQRIAYLSCSAGTLARDLEAFQQAGYRVKTLIPYDFFPQTYHVETLALIENPS
ncbi:MAG: hypothetical protein OQK12_13225 [Motiliproteus sp.]|nr:hypothetical protein [Motiliproteus sp.]MCW9051072.1 hypothetical protein [Motiliproteus sp.]